jgi:cation diffusion facilitator family transporter
MAHLPRAKLTRYAWLSIGAALLTLALKAGAFALTGSVAFLSDAMETIVNLGAAMVAVIALAVGARPPDEDHAYGHGKVEYFSSGVEGTLIVLAAIAIWVEATGRLLEPVPLTQPGVGTVIILLAAAINLGVALILRRVGRRERSVTLEADAQHLLSDVLTSVGVVLGVLAASVTGWAWLDPVVALAVGVSLALAGSASCGGRCSADGYGASRRRVRRRGGCVGALRPTRRRLPRIAHPAGRGAGIRLGAHPGAG